MKKRHLCFAAALTAAALSAAMVLTSCGKKEPAATTAAPAETSAAVPESEPEAPYEAQKPLENKLDEKTPIPGDTGTLTLTEQVFETENLKLMLPEGVSVEYEEPDKNMGHVTVKSDDGVWKLLFRPYIFGYSLPNNVDSTIIYDGHPIKEDWSRDIHQELAGFDARVWANNIREGWLHPSNEQDAPAVDILLDYGETLAGPWYGLYVRLEAQEPTKETNIYDLLYLRHVRAVLNNFSVITTPEGIVHEAGGIKATFPARWDVKDGENSIVTSFHGASMTGGITFMTTVGADPKALADSREGEKVEKSYNGRDFYGVITENKTGSGEDEKTSYHLSMYSAFNDKRSFQAGIGLRDFGPEELKQYLDNENFTAVMESLELDPNGYHEPGKAEVNGLVSDRGSITSYSGTDAELEIPAEIGGYSTVYIGGRAFKDNASLKSVVVPEGVTWIQDSAFENCSALEKVTLPDTLVEISQNAFRNCPNLTDVVLPDTCAQVGTAAFAESGKGSFTGSPAFYDRRCFADSTFETISLPAGSDISSDHMFYETAASKVTLPEDLEVLGESAFANTSNIHEIVLPETVREIGNGAFVNMRGLMKLNLPEGIEELPENMTASTTTDVIIVPKSVKKIGSQAIYDANIVVIQNPNVEIEGRGIDGDYVYLENAKDYVFPSGATEVMTGCRIYLDGIYDPTNDIQGDFYAATSFSSQVYLPMDATEAESDSLDAFLKSVGFQEIAWISGTDKEFLPDSTYDFDVQNNTIKGYHGESKKLGIPDYAMMTDGTFWYTENVYAIADEAFAGKGFVSAFFKGNLGDGTGARILKDNPDLKDIWFNAQILFDMQKEKPVYDPAAFEGVPDDVTVHLPASFTEEQRKDVEDYLHSIGMPAGASFAYYNLRGGNGETASGSGSASSGAAAGAGTAAAGNTAAGNTAAGGNTAAKENTAEGTYYLSSMMGMDMKAFAAASGVTEEEAQEMMMVEVKDKDTAVFTSDGESSEVKLTIDGDKITMEAEGEVLEGTLKDGVMTLTFDGVDVILTKDRAGDGSSKTDAGSGKTDASSSTPGQAKGAEVLNDGTIEGTYYLYTFLGMSVGEFAEMSGIPASEAAKYMTIEVKGDGSAIFAVEGEDPDEVAFTVDGENYTMEADGEKLEGTIKDGLLTISMEGAEVVLARYDPAALSSASSGDSGEESKAETWTGLYTKFVGDPDSAKEENEPFSLDLKEDGTGVHHRNDMDFKVTWELKGEDFTMKETFIGDPIVYTGTMKGNSLHIFNGDPKNDLTCEYVYEK